MCRDTVIENITFQVNVTIEHRLLQMTTLKSLPNISF